MEHAGFLNVPHQNGKFFNIISWNINGARTKLDKKEVNDFLICYDIICLNEVKTPCNVTISGYIPYRSKAVNGAASRRGGTIVFIKNYLSKYVYNVDLGIVDQVWLQLHCVPNVMFGFCYIPPSDSTYFSPQSFVNLHEKMVDYRGNIDFCIIGDMNARFGSSVRNIPLRSSTPGIVECTYPIIPDDVPLPNDNSFLLSNLCVDNNLVVVNNIQTATCHFPSNKTFKKRKQWISELDTAVVSFNLLKCINRFTVHQTNWLPSDHAPISIALELPKFNMDIILSRAGNLGGHGSLMGQAARGRLANRPIKFGQIDLPAFSNTLNVTPIPEVITDTHTLADNISNTLYSLISSCVTETSTQNGLPESVSPSEHSVYTPRSRWDRLLQDPDDARVWKAINWKGQLIDNNNSNDCPSDIQFKQFYDNCITQNSNAPLSDNVNHENNINVPILDNQILPIEISEQINSMKADKSCGLDGIPPGVYKLLTPAWIMLITTLFNSILTSASYPSSWTKAKLFMLFKRGNRKDPNNYRGISVINSIAKLFDMVLCNRLELWFKPYREQAGAQKGRGCIEHIVTLRLLSDYAKKKKTKLFMTFVDFSKAYDLVPRNMLFLVLKRLGCGAAMLSVLVAMYNVTQSVIGTAIITTAIGVRQGSPTSCLLFILYVNDLIKLIKETCEPDGFLSWLHLLMLMDDTVLLATSREKLIKKVTLLVQFCKKYGMVINESKTKLMVINGTINDKQSIVINNLSIQHCDIYIYLGSPFTSDGSLSSAVKSHVQEKMAHFHKFIAFLDKNNDIPFIIKKRVFDACLLSALLYGCESWLNADLKPVSKLYNWALKQMLGVRLTTCNDVCYIESGYAPLTAIVRNKQRIFFGKMYNNRINLSDDPLGFVLKFILSNRYNTKNYLNKLINNSNINDCQNESEKLKNCLRRSESSRRRVYCNEINANLDVHDIYFKKHNIFEIHRIAFTRFRVSSHSLAVETGRWNRRGRGRLPLEERLCSCGLVQSEEHVISICPHSQQIRNSYGFSCINDLMSGRFDNDIVCKIIYEILDLYD